MSKAGWTDVIIVCDSDDAFWSIIEFFVNKAVCLLTNIKMEEKLGFLKFFLPPIFMTLNSNIVILKTLHARVFNIKLQITKF